jgi:hypothetical protein
VSLEATIVPFDDGKYYRDPVIGDESGDWYVCFDEDEPPELVIKAEREGGCDLEAAKAILKEAGIEYGEIRSDGSQSWRFFPADKWQSLLEARNYFFELEDLPPVTRIIEHEGVVEL